MLLTRPTRVVSLFCAKLDSVKVERQVRFDEAHVGEIVAPLGQ